MTKNSLIFGGVNSADYGVWISGTDTFAAPERDVQYVSVPGRNGDLIIDNGKWNNIQLTYPAFINKEFYTQMTAFRSEICKLRGYQRLEDTYHPDEYRMAAFTSGLTPKVNSSFIRSADFDITFNCKPQRFLKSGDEPIQILPVTAMASTLYSQYIPVNGDLTFETHCGEDTLTVTIKTYDATGTQLTSNAHTCTDGDSETVTFANTDIYFRIIVTGYSDVDTTWLRVQTITTYNGTGIPVDAVMARTWSIVNPTGYAAKPLIEVYGTALPYMTIRNMNNGVRTSYYVFNSTDTGVEHFWMDCDMQYLYDESKANLTSHLRLTTAESNVGEGLVFPELGTEEIQLYTYNTTSVVDNGIGLVNIYPHWWRL